MADGVALKPGSLLSQGRYRIESQIGSGGFSLTYLATDLQYNYKVAIKELFPKVFCHRDESTSRLIVGGYDNEKQMDKLKTQFLNEARHLQALSDPGIVKVYDSFEEHNTAYYVMDYIQGNTVSEIVKQNGPLPESRALAIINEVGQSLAYLHSQDMNHLDIKPSNIMIRNADGQAVLIDFGLSIHFDSNNHATLTMPHGISDGYAPVEQYAVGAPVRFSAPTDIYALGATLFYMLTGQKPVPSIHRATDQDLIFPPGVSMRLRGPIMRAMALLKANRYPTVNAFLGDLMTGGHGFRPEPPGPIPPGPIPPGPIPPGPIPGPVPQPPTPSKNFPAWVWVIIALVIGAFLIFGIGGYLAESDSKNNEGDTSVTVGEVKTTDVGVDETEQVGQVQESSEAKPVEAPSPPSYAINSESEAISYINGYYNSLLAGNGASYFADNVNKYFKLSNVSKSEIKKRLKSIDKNVNFDFDWSTLRMDHLSSGKTKLVYSFNYDIFRETETLQFRITTEMIVNSDGKIISINDIQSDRIN